MDFHEAVGQVILWRKEQGLSTAKLEALQDQFRQDHAALFAQVAADTEKLAEVNKTVRAMAVENYEATGEKHPYPGINIRVMQRLSYDPREALRWAMEHQIALSLDKPRFEAIALVDSLGFVSVSDEPIGTIAASLALIEEKEDELPLDKGRDAGILLPDKLNEGGL